jgi:ssDNA-binding Zn-finger/Zn-ribbon topoisomerase 1
MLEGRCPKCGIRQVGWALHWERYQACPACGTGLDIYENGRLVARGYSPFTAEEYVIKPSPPVPTALEESTDER